MNATTVIPTDLVTPLGAYLRLRETGPAAFLLESVEHGRLGRYSFVGSGSELVSFAEAEARAEPVVGYLGYDHAATLEPTVALPADGPVAPGEQVRRRRHACALRPRARPRRGAVGRPIRNDSASRRAAAGAAGRQERRRAHAPLPVAARLRAGSADGDRAHPRGRRLPDRPLAARRTADAGKRHRHLPDAAPDQPVAVQLPARARRRLARRLVSGDARASRRTPRQRQPDRRDGAARARRRRAAARLGEGPRRARDARRSRPQRPLARLRGGLGDGRAIPRGRALLPRHASRLGSGEGRSARK